MHAELLRDFFRADATVAELARDLRDAFEPRPDGSRCLRLANIEGEFVVTSTHLLRVIDAALAGSPPAADLAAVGAALAASGQFLWDEHTPDGARVGAAVREWCSESGNDAFARTAVVRLREELRASAR
jgi:hypothetical protein